MKSSPHKDVTVEQVSQKFQPDPKRQEDEITLSKQTKVFDPCLKASLFPNDGAATLRTSRFNSIQYLETGVAHKSIRTLQNI